METNNNLLCAKCGSEMTEGQEFCPKCGRKVGSNDNDTKKIAILLAALAVLVGGILFFTNDVNSIRLQYVEDSYEEDIENIFEKDAETVWLLADASESLIENWSETQQKISNGKLKGVFSETVEYVVEKGDNGEVSYYYYDSEDIVGIEDDPDKAVVDTIKLEDGTVKVVLVDSYGDDESFDFEILLFTEDYWEEIKYDYLEFDFDPAYCVHGDFEFRVINND